MGDVNVAVIRQDVGTSTGNLDITQTGFGTPKAAIFLYGIRSGLDAVGDHAGLCVGFTDGTRHRCYSVWYDNAIASSTQAQSRYMWDNGRISGMYLYSATRTEYEISFVSWITDGVRVNRQTYFGNNRDLFVILINGDDVTAYVNDITMSTVSVTNDVTDPGFQPNAVFFAGIGHTSYQSPNNRAILSHGWAVDDGSDTNRCVMHEWYGYDNPATAGAVYYGEDSCTGQLVYNGATPTWKASCAGWDSNGFTLTSDTTSTGGDEVGYLALKLDNTDIYLATMDTPTSTGNDTLTVGHQSVFTMFGQCLAEAVNTVYTDNNSEGMGIGVSGHDGSDIVQLSKCLCFMDNSGTNCYSASEQSETYVLNTRDVTGATTRPLQVQANITTRGNDSWTLNYGTVHAQAKKHYVFSMGEVVSAFTPSMMVIS